MKMPPMLFTAVVLSTLFLGLEGCTTDANSPGSHFGGIEGVADLVTIHPDIQTGVSTGGWEPEEEAGPWNNLKAGGQVVAAEMTGPGIIRHIHSVRVGPPGPEGLFTRGLVLEIWFDDAAEPAVMVPMADFFGDGCNGNAMDFTSNLIECAPESYNSYFPMPFQKNAKVIIRNDTAFDIVSYCVVEWESLPEWDDSLGYFHATYNRKCFQLSRDSNETFFEVEGMGHFIGRQYSVVSDEPLFRDFTFIMEGDNEVDIDGVTRAVDYLGSEDSFTFSWGFQREYAGLHAGITFRETGDDFDFSRLSVYRFHDHLPIRFSKSFRWRINWEWEGQIARWPGEWAKRHQEALNQGGAWVDYATVYYWYQNSPGGFKHKPLPPVEKRREPMLCRPEGHS